jgi:dipeptide transport system substrate-binding protein
LQVGDCQVMGDADADAVKTAESDPQLTVARGGGLDISYLAFNTAKPPFNDPRVRQALSYAIDRQAIVDQVYQGLAAPGTTLMPPAMSGFDSSVLHAFHSTDRAKALLAEAGVSDLKLDIMALDAPRPYDPNPAETAKMIAADFAKVGVTATVTTPQPVGAFLRQSIDKDRDAAVLFGWSGGNGDPDDFLSLLLSCKAVGSSNRAEWCDEGFTALIEKARKEKDPAARAALYAEAQRTIADQQPVMPLAHGVVAVPMAKTVTGYVVDPFGHHDFGGVDLSE